MKRLRIERKNVLDEREMQEVYRIEHSGLWLMYALLCAAVVVQLMLGAGMAQMAGEMIVIGVVSVVMIAAYARRGIWDTDARPSVRGNAIYALLAALGVAVVTLGKSGDAVRALIVGGAMFALCFLLLTALMLYVRRRQREAERDLDD